MSNQSFELKKPKFVIVANDSPRILLGNDLAKLKEMMRNRGCTEDDYQVYTPMPKVHKYDLVIEADFSAVEEAFARAAGIFTLEAQDYESYDELLDMLTWTNGRWKFGCKTIQITKATDQQLAAALKELWVVEVELFQAFKRRHIANGRDLTPRRWLTSQPAVVAMVTELVRRGLVY